MKPWLEAVYEIYTARPAARGQFGGVGRRAARGGFARGDTYQSWRALRLPDVDDGALLLKNSGAWCRSVVSHILQGALIWRHRIRLEEKEQDWHSLRRLGLRAWNSFCFCADEAGDGCADCGVMGELE